ncbi:hypothetical protein PAMP_012468 [Pampus punctatissimus]
MAEGGSAQAGQHDVKRRPSLNTESLGINSGKNNEKVMSRTKDLGTGLESQKAPGTIQRPGFEVVTPLETSKVELFF